MARASVAVLVVAVVVALVPQHAAAACARWAASNGSDTNAGSRGSPFRSVGKLVSSLRAGQTGCLAPGSEFPEHLVVARTAGRPGHPVRIRTAGGRRAVIDGTVRLLPGAHDFILAAVVVHGDGSPAGAIVDVRADRVTLVRVAVSGPGYTNRDIPCILLTGGPSHVVIDHAEVSNCTRITTHAAHAPGIVVAHARSTVIRDSFVFHVPGDGIVLAPDSQGTHVVRTVVDGNVSAVFIGGDKRTASSRNIVADSILSFSGKWNVHSLWLGRHGFGNVVTGNCIWRGFRRNVAGSGFAAYGNLVTAPRYVNRPATLSMRRGPCYSKRPVPAELSKTDLGLPWPKVRRFTVHYAVRAVATRVQVVSLTVRGLPSGTPVELRCVRGCRASERTIAGGDGVASSGVLIGQWLPRGAVIEVRARHAGWVGAYARVVVTGLPRGVAITHACLSPLEQEQPVSCGWFA